MPYAFARPRTALHRRFASALRGWRSLQRLLRLPQLLGAKTDHGGSLAACLLLQIAKTGDHRVDHWVLLVLVRRPLQHCNRASERNRLCVAYLICDLARSFPEILGLAV